jgi:hypothetical protein
MQGQEFTLVGDTLCSDNATDIENIEVLFGTFHVYDSSIQEVKKFAHSIPDQAYLFTPAVF